MFKIYKFGNNPKFELNNQGSNFIDEIYSFNEMDDLKLTQDYLENNKREIHLQSFQDTMMGLNDLAYEKTLIEKHNDNKENDKHLYSIFIFPPGSFKDNNYDEFEISHAIFNTKIDLKNLTEWIGIGVSIKFSTKLTLKEEKETLIIKMIVNDNKRTYSYNGLYERGGGDY